MTKYAMVRINLEAFSMDSAADADVKYDGYHSVIQRVMIKTAFEIHDLDNDKANNYVNTDATVKVLDDIFNTYAI